MPNMASITVKKNDGTTDIIYDVKSQSAGDGTWASWRQDSGNSLPFSARPTLMTRVSESAKGVRRVDVVYTYPYAYTDTTTSQVVLSPLAISFRNGVWTVPQGLPLATILEAGSQFCNLMGHATMKSALNTQTAFV